MKKKITVIIAIIVLAVILLAIVIGLLFAYRMDLFIDKNRDSLKLELKDRDITIPLKHKYEFTSPGICIFESNVSIDDICKMFDKSINANDEIVTRKIGEVYFLYLYTDGVFVQSLFIEHYGDQNNRYRIGVNAFIPVCLYNESDNFEELFQDPNKLVDGGVYTLEGNSYENSFGMLCEYLSYSYVIKSFDDTSVSLIIDNKNITIKV